MRILLIKPKHIGDSLILTPTITAIKEAYLDAEVWVLVRYGCEGILAGCPQIYRILTLPGVEKEDRGTNDMIQQLKTLWQLLNVKFDYVFELGDTHRGRFIAMLTSAKKRYSVKTSSPLNQWEQMFFTKVSRFDWQTCHRIEKDYHTVGEFLHLGQKIPALCFEQHLTQAWAPAEKLTDFCVMQIGSRQGFARWNEEGWVRLGHELLERFPHIVISCGNIFRETELSKLLGNRLGDRAILTMGRANWAQMAGLLYRARYYVGPSTATMHLAAACQCPVIALFGPTIEDHWHPWQVEYRIVTDPRYKRLDHPGHPEDDYDVMRKRSMDAILPGDVIKACDEIMSLPRKK